MKTRRLSARQVEQRMKIIERMVLEGYRDEDIGKVLGLSVPAVCQWRQRFGIPAADKFARTFTRTYGPDAIETFIAQRRHGTSLAELGRTFGFTREYARQVEECLQERGFYDTISDVAKKKKTKRGSTTV